MRYAWIDEYLMSKPGVTKDLQAEWNWVRYHIGGKMFAAVVLDREDKPYYINLKLDPLEGEAVRAQYADVVPGYYSNERCWNSVRPDGAVPDDVLRRMLDTSYALVLNAFSGQKQREILGVSPCGTDCSQCPLHGAVCAGCNEAKGKVFHAPKGKACPIYACAVSKHHRPSCAGCDAAPCDIWRATRDPSMTDGQFDASIRERMEKLARCFPCKRGAGACQGGAGAP